MRPEVVTPFVASYVPDQSGRSLSMTITLELLEAEALKLAPSDRSRLLERLMESLDEDHEIEAAWDAVAEDREARVGAASAATVPMEQAFARLEARFPG